MATRVWGGGTGPVDGDWNTATNWTGDTVPANGDDVVFNTTDFTPCTVPNSSPLTLNSLTFNGYQDGGGYWGGSPPGTVLTTFFDILPFNLYISETFGNGQYSGVIRCDISGGYTFGTWEIPAAFMIPVYLYDNSGTLLTYDINWTSLSACASSDYDTNPPALGWILASGGGNATYRLNYPEEEVVYFRTHDQGYSNLAGVGGKIVFNKTGSSAKIISQNFDNVGMMFSGRAWMSNLSTFSFSSIVEFTVNCSVLTIDLRNVVSAINHIGNSGPYYDLSGYSYSASAGATLNATSKIVITGLTGSELYAGMSGVGGFPPTTLVLNTPNVEVRGSANVFRITNGNSYYTPGASVDSGGATGGSITCSGTLNFYDQSTFSGGLGSIGNYFAGFVLFNSLPSNSLSFYGDSVCLGYIEPGNAGVISLYENSKYQTASTSVHSFSTPNYTIYWGDPLSIVALNSSGSSF